jgi:hypothetical protein
MLPCLMLRGRRHVKLTEPVEPIRFFASLARVQMMRPPSSKLTLTLTDRMFPIQ